MHSQSRTSHGRKQTPSCSNLPEETVPVKKRRLLGSSCTSTPQHLGEIQGGMEEGLQVCDERRELPYPSQGDEPDNPIIIRGQEDGELR